MARIQILGQSGDYIELGENIEVPLNFSIADIKDIEKRKGAFSKTITVPGTKNNHDILKHYYNVNIENGDFINNIVKCALIGDSGEILFNNGVIQLLRVVKRNVVATGEDKVNYEILLKDDAGDFFANMSNKKLEDLFFQDLNHRYDLATVSASTFHTSVDGYKYILPHIEPQGLPTDNQYKLTELKPGIYAERYLKSIFQSNGYTYTWSEANSNDIQFDKLIVPYNGDVPKLDEQDVQQFRVVAELSAATQFVLGASFDTDARISTLLFADGIGRTQTILTDEIEDIQSLYTTATGIYAPNYDAQSPGGIDFSFEIDYDVIASNTHGVNVQLKPKNLVSVPVGTDIITMEVISTVKNNTQNINYDYYFDSFNLKRDYTLVPGDNVLYSSSKTFTQVAPNINSFNQLINGLSLKVSHIFAGQTTKEGKWYIPAGAGTDVSIAYQIRVNSVKMTILPSVNNAASYGSIINMNKFVPKNIQQKDFLRSLMMMFNLFIIPDETNPGNLIIKNKDTYYSEGIITDWTDYLAKDLPQEITFLSDLNAKRLTLTYKQDSDVSNKGYFENTGEIYGQSEFVFDNEYTKGDEKKEIIFSPTPNANTSFAANLPIITGAAPKTNIRILYDGGNLPCQEYTIIETGQIASGFTSYPYVGHFDKPVNSNYDLNFSTPDYLFYDDFNTITQNNLFNKFWRNTFSQINNSKVLTAYFILDDSIISKFRMNDKIYLKQYESYWVVNQIYDYIVGGKVPTKVELVQVQDLGVRPIVKSYKKPAQVEFPAPGKRFKYLNSAPNRSDINIYGFDNYVTNNSTQIEIIGSNNNVGGSNISIYGNDNIDYWDNTTVNVSNLIITNPNSVNNVVQGLSASTWAEVLANGNQSGPTNPVLTNGTSIGGGEDPSVALATNILYLGDSTVNDGTWYLGDLYANTSEIRFDGTDAHFENAAGYTRINGNNIRLDSIGEVFIVTQPLTGSSSANILVRELSGEIREIGLSAITSSSANTWANVLANGNVSGPTNPILSDGKRIGGGDDPDTAGSVNVLDLGDSTTLDFSWWLGDRDFNLAAIRYNYGANSLKMASTGNVEVASSGPGNDYGLNLFGPSDSGIQILDNSINTRTSESIDSFSIFIGTNNSTIDSGVTNSVVIGGGFHSMSGTNSVIAGGLVNTIETSSDRTFIGGGDSGSILGTSLRSALIGGANNTITDHINAAIIGGTGNAINSGSNSIILGGTNMTANFINTVYQQDSYRDAGNHIVTTTNNTTTDIYTFTPDSDGVWMIDANTSGFEAATGDAIGAKSFAVFKVIAGVCSAVSTNTLDRKSDFPASHTVLIDTDGTNIRVRVTGGAGKTINWKCSLTLTK